MRYQMHVPITIQALGNEGFFVKYNDMTLIFDPITGDNFLNMPSSQLYVKLILVTHAHWDHFNIEMIRKIACPTTRIIGPAPVATELRKHKMSQQIVEMEPLEYGESCHLKIDNVDITAFRTVHNKSHNSYLVSFPDFRLFHDGDNELTNSVPVEDIGKVNVLFLCPWQESRWEKFIDRLKPEYWVIMHLTDDEYNELERGVFFNGISNYVPRVPVVLRPGQKIEIQRRR